MRKKKVLICGASGFIGRNLFETFSKRHDLEVYGLYYKNNPFPSNANLIHADLRIDSQVRAVTKGTDILIHAAAVTAGSKAVSQKPHEFITDNVMMNTLLWRAVHENHVPRVIFMSCTVMYPNIDRPVQETDTVFEGGLHPSYFGGAWVKIFAEKLAEFYAGQGRTQFTIVRHSNIYGPYDKYDLERAHVFGASVTKVLTAENGRVEIYGSGNAVRDLLYISDLVDFVEKVIERQTIPFEIFNVGLGEGISVKDLVQNMVTLSERQLEVICDTTKSTIENRLVLNTNKAKNSVGWRPKIGLEEGILRTFNWYRQHCLSRRESF